MIIILSGDFDENGEFDSRVIAELEQWYAKHDIDDVRLWGTPQTIWLTFADALLDEFLGVVKAAFEGSFERNHLSHDWQLFVCGEEDAGFRLIWTGARGGGWS